MISDTLDDMGIAAVDPALRRAYRLIAHDLHRCRDLRGRPIVAGICGPQGSGKSTAAGALAAVLQRCHQLRAAVLSLDDFYLSRADRARLAEGTHPLFVTRGVPGTHDVPQALATIAALLGADDTTVTPLPRFDKATDDPRPDAGWPRVMGRIDVVLIEGWCVGARPQTAAALVEPINTLEAQADADGRWRRHVNTALGGPYQDLFGTIDRLMMIAAPSFDCVFAWRREQEQRLAARCLADPSHAAALMDDAALARFIMHYERITRHVLAAMPDIADIVLRIDQDRRCTDLLLRNQDGTAKDAAC